MPYNSNTLFQKMPDKVSFFYAQISEKWLELFLKKFPSYTFRNNVESETVLYLTNGRKRSKTIASSLTYPFQCLAGSKASPTTAESSSSIIPRFCGAFGRANSRGAHIIP